MLSNFLPHCQNIMHKHMAAGIINKFGNGQCSLYFLVLMLLKILVPPPDKTSCETVKNWICQLIRTY